MKVETGDLKKIRFFEKYTDEQLGKISRISSIKEFRVKELIFEQYDELSEVYVLLSGSLSLGINLPPDRRIHLGTIEEEQLFSWSAVFYPYISTAWVTAVTPANVIAIDARKLNSEMEEDCDFGFKTMSKIAHTISQRLSDTRYQLMNQMNI